MQHERFLLQFHITNLALNYIMYSLTILVALSAFQKSVVKL